MSITLHILSILFTIRIVSLIISIFNEKKLKKQGAVQYGIFNSFLLSLAHFVFYVSSFYEAYSNKILFNEYSVVGICLAIFSYFILFYVIYELRDIWTVKIYIAPDHKIVKSFLFRMVSHPNYLLNIIPELIGVGLLCNAWKTMAYVLPFYLVFLVIRIIQEEKAMKKVKGFTENVSIYR